MLAKFALCNQKFRIPLSIKMLAYMCASCDVCLDA